MSNSINITKRNRTRTLADGSKVQQVRFVVNFNDPKTQKRAQRFFPKRRDAESFKQELIVDISNGEYFSNREDVTVKDVVELWFSVREGKVKPNTMRNHESIKPLILGPLLRGATREQRSAHTMTGALPEGTKVIRLLASVKIKDLLTPDIRRWFNLLEKEVGVYSAKRAKMLLKSALELGAEDYNYRPPAMPKIIESRTKAKKEILTPEQIAQVLDYAEEDVQRGLYYAFPFLAGTRPSEQLALLWSDIDLEAGTITIQRSQDSNGNVYDSTKTEAGTRDVPMSPRLRSMLLQHRLTCTRLNGELYRVFPGLGRHRPWPHLREGGGGQLIYQNWRTRFWKKGLNDAGVPYVTPHSARHAFISNLQAQGIEVGLVAKIAGHANPMVTLGHYTQAVRDGQEAIKAIDAAYGLGGAA